MPAPAPATRHNFIVSYTAAYGQEPPRLATLAYDADCFGGVVGKTQYALMIRQR